MPLIFHTIFNDLNKSGQILLSLPQAELGQSTVQWSLSAQEPIQEFYLLLLVQIRVNGLDKFSLRSLFGHRGLPCLLDLSITQVRFCLRLSILYESR